MNTTRLTFSDHLRAAEIQALLTGFLAENGLVLAVDVYGCLYAVGESDTDEELIFADIPVSNVEDLGEDYEE
jgi:hypothetical protein